MDQVWSRCSMQLATDLALHERCAAAVTPAAVLAPSALTKVTTLSHLLSKIGGNVAAGVGVRRQRWQWEGYMLEITASHLLP